MMRKALLKTIYVLGACGWCGIAVLPWFGYQFSPLIASILCMNMALTFARWSAE